MLLDYTWLSRSFAVGGHELVNKLEKLEAWLYPSWIEFTQLKDEFLSEIFAASCVPVV